MKWALGIAVAAGAGLVALWAMGYTLQVSEGSIEVIGPARVSPYDAEAEANSPECKGLKERFPEKLSYTMEEFDARTKAAQACIDAKTRYIRNKIRSR
jgi:hypothetical protein